MRTDIKYQLLVSSIGLFIVLIIAIFPPPISVEFMLRKQLTGSIFGIFCLFGILATISPTKCKQIVNIKKETLNPESTNPTSRISSTILRGHHPTCGKYNAHVTEIKDKTFCAACIGLLTGGILSFAGTITYFFCNWQIADNGTLIALFGIVCLSFGLFQFKFSSFVRLFANTIFVLGATSILVAIDSLTNNLFLDLFVICLICYWLITRIMLSDWDHELICSNCEIEKCSRKQKKEGD